MPPWILTLSSEHCLSLYRPLRVVAGTAAIAAIPICLELGLLCFSSMHCSFNTIRFLLVLLKQMIRCFSSVYWVNIHFLLTTYWSCLKLIPFVRRYASHPTNTVFSLHVNVLWVQLKTVHTDFFFRLSSMQGFIHKEKKKKIAWVWIWQRITPPSLLIIVTNRSVNKAHNCFLCREMVSKYA